jgi:hypothetical protein
MIVYSKEIFIKAHEDMRNPYKNHHYDRYVRDIICGSCGEILGEQVKYVGLDEEFSFEETEKNKWKFCPCCGEKLY